MDAFNCYNQKSEMIITIIIDVYLIEHKSK